jgi:hypothetical protein
MCLDQGTWQFMAADLVDDPTIPQTFIHDLESTFWVLLWVVLSYMETNWTDATCSSILKDMMSPRIYHSSSGATGGRNKMSFLTSPRSLFDLEVYNNPIIHELLDTLRQYLSSRYEHPSKTSRLDGLVQHVEADVAPQELNEALKTMLLKDHSLILSLLSTSLGLKGWPADDASKRQPLQVSREVETCMQSGAKRLRSRAEENGVFIHPLPVKRT